MQLAKGDFIGIINSDDVYLSKTLEILKNILTIIQILILFLGGKKTLGCASWL